MDLLSLQDSTLQYLVRHSYLIHWHKLPESLCHDLFNKAKDPKYRIVTRPGWLPIEIEWDNQLWVEITTMTWIQGMVEIKTLLTSLHSLTDIRKESKNLRRDELIAIYFAFSLGHPVDSYLNLKEVINTLLKYKQPYYYLEMIMYVKNKSHFLYNKYRHKN